MNTICIIFEDLSLNKLSGSHIKWQYCHSPLRSMHCHNVTITYDIKSKSTKVVQSPVA